MNFTIQQVTPTCFDLVGDLKAGDHWFFLCSDVHWDNPKCNRDLFHAHMQEAKKRGAPVLIFGDFFCAMQGKYDPRRSKKSIRPEHNVANYLDAIVTGAAEDLAPYADNIALISYGNHERAILSNCETCLLERLTTLMRDRYESNVLKAGYHGIVRIKFRQNSGKVRSTTLYFHHGKFGGVVSKGTQGIARHGLVVPQADIVVTGHTHDQWHVKQPRFHWKANGQMEVRDQHHVKTGTYKEEFATDMSWAVERIVMPKSLGGCWLRINVHGEDKVLTVTPIST